MAENVDFAFAFSLYHRLSKENFKNMFISPYSISAALSMVLLGAEGNTATELIKGLGFSDTGSSKIVHNQQHELIKQLAKVKGVVTLESANKLFVEQSYQLTSKFVEDTAKFYESQSDSVDFAKNFESSRHLINKWVEDKTRNKIKDLLPSGSLNSLTRLVIANAVYFKGDWLNKFDHTMTHLSDFYVDKTHVVKVQMMKQEKKFQIGYDLELGVQVVSLPYKGETVSMILLVPTERFGLKALESKLSPEKLNALTSQLSKEKVVLSMPRMKLDFSLDLIPILQSLGIRDVFDVGKADLSGISGNRDLFVSGVYHKAFLEVNEEGSEAAAATAAVMMLRCMPAMPVRITCDHPFMFLIKHNPTRSILFMGRFVTP